MTDVVTHGAIVVLGIFLSLGLIWTARWLWSYFYAGPRLVIECGESEDPRDTRGTIQRRRPVDEHPYAPVTVYVAMLVVQETRGRGAGWRVQVRVTATEPAPDYDAFPQGLQAKVNSLGLHWRDYIDVMPGSFCFVRLSEEVRDSEGGRVKTLTWIPGLAPGTTVLFTVEALVDGRRNGRLWKFAADWSEADSCYPSVSVAT